MRDTFLATTEATTARVGAYTALAGVICAFIGTGLWLSSGADMDAALVADDMAGYLTAAGANRSVLVANLVIWIVMVFLLGIAGSAISALGHRRQMLSRTGAYCYYVGVPTVLVAYTAWLAIVVQLAPDTSEGAVMLANVIGWFASRSDWIATILVVGIGPTFLALAGRDVWAPRWIVIWGYFTALAALLNAVAMLTGGAGLATYGFLVVPVGVLWMMAAGIVLLRWQPANS